MDRKKLLLQGLEFSELVKEAAGMISVLNWGKSLHGMQAPEARNLRVDNPHVASHAGEKDIVFFK